DELLRGVVNFKEHHTKELADVRAAVDGLGRQMAAYQIGPADGEPGSSPDARRAKAAFASFARLGDPKPMAALAPNAAMTTDSNPDGGYTVPEKIGDTIIDQLVDMNPIRGLATVVQTDTSDFKQIVNRRGMSSGWVSERQGRPETDPA